MNSETLEVSSSSSSSDSENSLNNIFKSEIFRKAQVHAALRKASPPQQISHRENKEPPLPVKPFRLPLAPLAENSSNMSASSNMVANQDVGPVEVVRVHQYIPSFLSPSKRLESISENS